MAFIGALYCFNVKNINLLYICSLGRLQTTCVTCGFPYCAIFSWCIVYSIIWGSKFRLLSCPNVLPQMCSSKLQCSLIKWTCSRRTSAARWCAFGPSTRRAGGGCSGRGAPALRPTGKPHASHPTSGRFPSPSGEIRRTVMHKRTIH